MKKLKSILTPLLVRLLRKNNFVSHSSETKNQNRIYVWDLIVRLFHWTVAVLFIVNFWFFEAGEYWHNFAGYIVIAALVLRCVWGFWGSKNALFSAFFPTPKRLRQYIKKPTDHHFPAQGHNPLGGLMIFFILLLLITVSISGWLQETDAYWGVEWPQVLHEVSTNILMMAAAIHIVAVFVIQKKYGIKLIKPMLTGWRDL